MASMTADERGVEQGFWPDEQRAFLVGHEVRVVDLEDGRVCFETTLDGRRVAVAVTPTDDRMMNKMRMITGRREVERGIINFKHYGTLDPTPEQRAANPLPGSRRATTVAS